MHRYRDPQGELIEAARWESARIEYAAEVVGWLMFEGPDYRCRGGGAPNTLLVLTGCLGGTPVASTGDYIARKGSKWTVIPREQFESMVVPVEGPLRQQ